MTDATFATSPPPNSGQRIAAGEISSVDATEAYLERIAQLDGNYASYITVPPTGPGRRPPRRRRNRRRQPARPSSRRARGRQGPVQHRRHRHHQRLHHPGRERARRGRHHHGPPARGRHGAAGQAQHERVRQRRRLPPSLRPAPQPLGHRPQPRHLQQRLRRGDGGLPVRHLPGRGHRRQHPRPRRLLRVGGHSPHLRPGQPPWGLRRQLVHGYRRPHLPHRHRLRPHPGRHRRPRPPGTRRPGTCRCPTTPPPWTATSAA